jgi:hypothetical protein
MAFVTNAFSVQPLLFQGLFELSAGLAVSHLMQDVFSAREYDLPQPSC